MDKFNEVYKKIIAECNNRKLVKEQAENNSVEELQDYIGKQFYGSFVHTNEYDENRITIDDENYIIKKIYYTEDNKIKIECSMYTADRFGNDTHAQGDVSWTASDIDDFKNWFEVELNEGTVDIDKDMDGLPEIQIYALVPEQIDNLIKEKAKTVFNEKQLSTMFKRSTGMHMDDQQYPFNLKGNHYFVGME